MLFNMKQGTKAGGGGGGAGAPGDPVSDVLNWFFLHSCMS